MPANVEAIFPVIQQVNTKTLTTADTSLTVPTTNSQILITGGANGTRIDGLKIRALGTNVQTVLRIFFNDGLGVLASNFGLVHEVKLPATTASVTDVNQAVDVSLLPVNYDNAGTGVLVPYLKSGQKLYATIGTTVASGVAVTIFGGDY